MRSDKEDDKNHKKNNNNDDAAAAVVVDRNKTRFDKFDNIYRLFPKHKITISFQCNRPER